MILKQTNKKEIKKMDTEEKSTSLMFYIFMGLMAIGFIGIAAFMIYSIIN